MTTKVSIEVEKLLKETYPLQQFLVTGFEESVDVRWEGGVTHEQVRDFITLMLSGQFHGGSRSVVFPGGLKNPLYHLELKHSPLSHLSAQKEQEIFICYNGTKNK